jgi:N-dimethylarginine dimethylaminohydrolase
MSGADYFKIEELNPYSRLDNQPDKPKAINEHRAIAEALELSGVKVIKVDPPADCQDGIYTANWGLCWRGKAVLSSLPNLRQAEEPYARNVLSSLGYELVAPPAHFSGQGDALPCGNYLFVGSNYRTDRKMHAFLASTFGCNVISLETVPELDSKGNPVINAVTGWPDSYFYDLDLALAVISEDLIAWCPEAFNETSRRLIYSLPLDKISVSRKEAEESFACNLVATGKTVVMSNRAPQLESELLRRGFKTVTPEITELSKGGGYIRCCTLTLA